MQSNIRGKVAFAATSQPNSRTTQLFINYKNNSYLDNMGFAPFAEISEDEMINVVDKIYAGYGERPSQSRIYREGNKYLESEFPLMDYLKVGTIQEN